MTGIDKFENLNGHDPWQGLDQPCPGLNGFHASLKNDRRYIIEQAKRMREFTEARRTMVRH